MSIFRYKDLKKYQKRAQKEFLFLDIFVNHKDIP
jgi:hypothetical protein